MSRSPRRNPGCPNRAAGYVRVSTEEQAQEGVSLDAQERALDAYCALRGLELAQVVRDPGVTGGTPLGRRDGGTRLLRLVRRREVRAVVAWKLERLFRDCADCLTVVGDWERMGVALHLVDLGGQAVQTSSAIGRFFLTIMAGAAELDRNQVRERTAAAMRFKAERGEYTGGGVPFGFRLDPTEGVLQPVPEEQATIAEARALLASGLSLRATAEELHRRGHRNRSGGRFHAAQVWRMVRPTFLDSGSNPAAACG